MRKTGHGLAGLPLRDATYHVETAAAALQVERGEGFVVVCVQAEGGSIKNGEGLAAVASRSEMLSCQRICFVRGKLSS